MLDSWLLSPIVPKAINYPIDGIKSRNCIHVSCLGIAWNQPIKTRNKMYGLMTSIYLAYLGKTTNIWVMFDNIKSPDTRKNQLWYLICLCLTSSNSFVQQKPWRIGFPQHWRPEIPVLSQLKPHSWNENLIEIVIYTCYFFFWYHHHPYLPC